MVDVLRNHYKTAGENYVLNSDPPIYNTGCSMWYNLTLYKSDFYAS